MERGIGIIRRKKRGNASMAPPEVGNGSTTGRLARSPAAARHQATETQQSNQGSGAGLWNASGSPDFGKRKGGVVDPDFIEHAVEGATVAGGTDGERGRAIHAPDAGGSGRAGDEHPIKEHLLGVGGVVGVGHVAPCAGLGIDADAA